MFNFLRQHFHPLWRLRKSSLFRALQDRLDPDFPCSIEGIRASVKLLRDASVILPHEGREIESMKAFEKTLKERRIELFFDVGAKIGTYSWIAIANGVREVFLFEPDKTNQRLLAKTIRSNSLNQCFLVPFAVSDNVGTARFLVDNASGATGSLENHSDNPSSLHHAYGMGVTVTVPTLHLDIFAEYAKSKSVMVKIDVEGAEVAVFEGARRFFTQVSPFVLVECFERSRLDYFHEIGYSIHPLPENCNYLLSPP
jgi:FkbM family methyltransferase